MKFNQAPPSVWQKPWHFIAFGCGIGAIPVAPGTFATIATVPLYLMLARLPFWLYLSVVIAGFIFSCWLCDWISKEIGVHDHGGMVIDEVFGYLITMFAVPPQTLWIIFGVILFRIFDILKPWPIYLADRHVKGGFGVMFDDAVAAIFSCIILHILLYFIH